MLTLAKFEVELSSDMITRHENIPVLWSDYLGVLEEAKKNLEANKERFKTNLLDQAEYSSESGSSENGEGTGEVGRSLGIGQSMGRVLGKI